MNVDRSAYRAMNVEKLQELVRQDPNRLQYHLMPPCGWLNDPNGLCQFQGIYHVYYQYSPQDVDGKIKIWGHYTSSNLLTWKCEEPVLYEDSEYDSHGVYSGCAFVEGGTIHYFYTGNVKLVGDFDYIHAGRLHNTMHVTSKDGYHFSKKVCVLRNEDYPSDISCHVRDPKVWKEKDRYYMVLGARDRKDRGCVLIYESKDLNNWTYAFRIQIEDFGYMWECPDFIQLDGDYYLFVCPQGLDKKKGCYENVYQSGYFPIEIDFCKHTYEVKEFHILDHGFDFYAPQTFLDEEGRRILIGWLGLPDIEYENPTTLFGWQHALTMPRELHAKNGRIYQTPIKEFSHMRQACAVKDLKDACFEVAIEIENACTFVLLLRKDVTLSYDPMTRIATLEMKESGYGRTSRHVYVKDLVKLHIFSDTSSLEIYFNDGEEVMTTRVYDGQNHTIGFDSITQKYRMECWRLNIKGKESK